MAASGTDPDKAFLLTGFNIYQKIVKWGGAGALVPITGFANSVAAPAIEYKAEGYVYGIGCKIFTIAGPVDPLWHLYQLDIGTDLLYDPIAPVLRFFSVIF